MSELGGLLRAYREAGGEDAALADRATAHLMLEGNRIVSMREVEGFACAARETPEGLDASIRVAEGVRLEKPVHLCFGMLHGGLQHIVLDVRFGRGARASFLAHCVFPDISGVGHVMDAEIGLEEGAEMRYSEVHFHGEHEGAEVRPTARVQVGPRARYFTDFSLTRGRVGDLRIDYVADARESAVVEMTARVFGRGRDRISIDEKVVLSGADARSLIKTRVALKDEARGDITGATEGNAQGARGHVDCMEIVRDRAVARAVPIVNVSHPGAKITHEAAIGSVDQRQLETLLAHGLTPEEAVDVIVRGVLR
ncbi:MAG: SufD family Fe-S cluster assembly protein [Nitrospirota bacterium]